jgi:hypothetical protein
MRVSLGGVTMEERVPRPGEIYNHFKDKPYQIITVATHSETGEKMVVYQALYGDFKTYVRPLEMFVSEVDKVKYPDVKQKYRFELRNAQEPDKMQSAKEITSGDKEIMQEARAAQADTAEHTGYISGHGEKNERRETKEEPGITPAPARISMDPAGKDRLMSKPASDLVTSEGSVNSILLEFLDANSYSKKLNVITGNIKHLNDRLINDMAVSLDCSVEEGPLEERIQGLIFCLKAMCRFEDRRLR